MWTVLVLHHPCGFHLIKNSVLQLHVWPTHTSVTATCASTTLWFVMVYRTVCFPGTRTTAKVWCAKKGVVFQPVSLIKHKSFLENLNAYFSKQIFLSITVLSLLQGFDLNDLMFTKSILYIKHIIFMYAELLFCEGLDAMG